MTIMLLNYVSYYTDENGINKDNFISTFIFRTNWVQYYML